MKRTFFRILPLAVAVLLATSCSKDENNDNAVVNNGQETVQAETMPISITVNQKGLSKLSCANGTGVDLQPIFEPGDELGIYIKDGDLLKTLVVAEENITNDGKTAVFEGELDADGLVDGVTELTAKIGTQITEAKTATSRENAVRQGCYQTVDFVYSKNGNSVLLEEQNAYIEVVWENKGNSTVEFSINSKSVPLTLNGQGQGWIVVPAGVTLTCEALGITDAKTTEKANIYGITRTFTNISLDKTTASVAIGKTETLTATTVPNGQEVTWSSSDPTVATVANGVVTPKKEGTTTITATFGELSATCTVTVIPEGYVDLDVVLENGTKVYFSSTVTSTGVAWSAKTEEERADWPTKNEFVNLKSDCYWQWGNDGTNDGYYVFKTHDDADKGKITNSSENHSYSTDKDPYIFLPVSVGRGGVYWSRESGGDDRAFCLYFNPGNVFPNYVYPKDGVEPGVVTVRRSN